MEHNNKHIGFIGLGRMGRNMAAHLAEEEYTVYGYDQSEDARTAAAAEQVQSVDSVKDLATKNGSTGVYWLMVPSAFVDAAIAELCEHIEAGATIIDGGNSFYKDSLRRHAELSEKEIHFLDCGTSGGMDGARNGASLMVGGDAALYETHEHIFRTLGATDGYARVGGNGAGHFVKMVHNGIEYGMMSALAEGMNVLTEKQEEFDIDLAQVLHPYENGSIITSNLLSWLAEAYREGQIDLIAGEVPKGETEDEMEHLLEIGAMPSLNAALGVRKATRTTPSHTGKLIAAMRNQFGGHKTVAKEDV